MMGQERITQDKDEAVIVGECPVCGQEVIRSWRSSFYPGWVEEGDHEAGNKTCLGRAMQNVTHRLTRLEQAMSRLEVEE